MKLILQVINKQIFVITNKLLIYLQIIYLFIYLVNRPDDLQFAWLVTNHVFFTNSFTQNIIIVSKYFYSCL